MCSRGWPVQQTCGALEGAGFPLESGRETYSKNPRWWCSAGEPARRCARSLDWLHSTSIHPHHPLLRGSQLSNVVRGPGTTWYKCCSGSTNTLISFKEGSWQGSSGRTGCGRTARRARQRGAHQARARAQAPAALGPRPALHDRAGSALHDRGTRPLRPRPGDRGARVDARAGAQKGQMSATRTENGRIGLRSTVCVATTVSCSVRTCQMSVR